MRQGTRQVVGRHRGGSSGSGYNLVQVGSPKAAREYGEMVLSWIRQLCPGRIAESFSSGSYGQRFFTPGLKFLGVRPRRALICEESKKFYFRFESSESVIWKGNMWKPGDSNGSLVYYEDCQGQVVYVDLDGAKLDVRLFLRSSRSAARGAAQKLQAFAQKYRPKAKVQPYTEVCGDEFCYGLVIDGQKAQVFSSGNGQQYLRFERRVSELKRSPVKWRGRNWKTSDPEGSVVFYETLDGEVAYVEPERPKFEATMVLHSAEDKAKQENGRVANYLRQHRTNARFDIAAVSCDEGDYYTRVILNGRTAKLYIDSDGRRLLRFETKGESVEWQGKLWVPVHPQGVVVSYETLKGDVVHVESDTARPA